MQAVFKSIQAAINGINTLFGWTVSFLLIAMMLLTSYIVIARYGFNTGSTQLQDSVTYLHACVFLLGAAFTLLADEHVRVDIFYRNFSPRKQALVDALGTLFLLLPLCAFLCWVSWDYTVSAWKIKEGSMDNGLPYVYVLKSLLVVAPALLFLQGVSMLIEKVGVLLSGKTTRTTLENTEGAA